MQQRSRNCQSALKLPRSLSEGECQNATRSSEATQLPLLGYRLAGSKRRHTHESVGPHAGVQSEAGCFAMAPSGFPVRLTVPYFQMTDWHCACFENGQWGQMILWLTNSVSSELFTAHSQPRTFFKDFATEEIHEDHYRVVTVSLVGHTAPSRDWL